MSRATEVCLCALLAFIAGFIFGCTYEYGAVPRSGAQQGRYPPQPTADNHAVGAEPRTGAPLPSVSPAQSDAQRVLVWPGVSSGAPHPSGGIGEPASYSKATPQPRIVSRPSGKVATWYPRTFGYGNLPTVALPDGHYIPAGRPVPYAVVCVFLPAARCETLPVVDFCGCGGSHIVDLSLGAVALFGLDPSTGVWPATVQKLP